MIRAQHSSKKEQLHAELLRSRGYENHLELLRCTALDVPILHDVAFARPTWNSCCLSNAYLSLFVGNERLLSPNVHHVLSRHRYPSLNEVRGETLKTVIQEGGR